MGKRVQAMLPLMLLVGALAACAPRYIEPGPAVGLPHLTATHLIARDGTPLALRRWESPAPRAIVIALHGFNDYSRCFAGPASSWEAAGITTYAYDQRGFGDSPVFGRWPGREALVNDLDDAVVAVRALHPDLPIYVLGESMGGAVALAWRAQNGATGVNGFVLVAPAVWGWSALNPLYKLTLWTSAHLTPGKTLTGARLKRWPSDNIPMLKALAADPKVIKATRIDTIYGLVGLMDLGYAGAAAPEADPSPPVLVLYGAKDQIVPAKPVRTAVARLGADARFAYYPDGYHMLLRDLEAERVRQDVLTFLTAPGQPLPSGLELRPKP